MHGNIQPPRPIARDPRAERIAVLSLEYLYATPDRREQIGAEVAALIDGKVAALPKVMKHNWSITTRDGSIMNSYVAPDDMNPEE